MDAGHRETHVQNFSSEEELEDFLAEPSQALIDELAKIDGDILVLGVAGKMGPSLARLAANAAPNKQVTGVARFSESGVQEQLNAHNVQTIKADLLDKDAIAALPDSANIIFMAGRKFGSSGSEDKTWAMNTHVPALVAERYRDANIVAFSTGCVYPFVPVNSQGASEDTPIDPPGEYAQSCVGRERLFQYFSNKHGTKGATIRLNYAIDMRYGVLADIAAKVLRGDEIDVTTGHVNVIWQGDANSQVLRALGHCSSPPNILNISGPESISVRWLATSFAQMLGKTANIIGQEAETGWVTNNAKSAALFGYPTVPLQTMMEWTADWVARGQHSFGKKTGFEVRDGKY
jgi:nucleoside-diphosphate-sugar epimerase